MTSILFVITQFLIKFTFVKYDIIHKEGKISSKDIFNKSIFFLRRFKPSQKVQCVIFIDILKDFSDTEST
jgi:hypothetical protein